MAVPSHFDSNMIAPPPPPVVSVQELAKENMSEVPESYIRPHGQEPLIPYSITTLPTIPIISMKNLLSDDKTLSSGELQKLHSTCKHWGIFQLVSHGMSSSLLEKLRHETEQLFNLPLEDKLKYRSIRAGSDQFEGYGGSLVRSENKLDWGDRFYLTVNPFPLRRPHLLSQMPLSFRDTMEINIKEMQKIGVEVLLLLCKCLGIEVKESRDLFEGEDGYQTMRISYYPPCLQPDLVFGLTPHSDSTAITILNQINGVDGLQIKRDDGVWLPIHVTPEAFVVNVGDVMEILSNGTYKSVEHRVMVNSDKERISIAMFFNPNLEAEMGPSPSIVNPNNPALFRRFKMEDYVKGFLSRTLNSKSYLEKMRITGNI